MGDSGLGLRMGVGALRALTSDSSSTAAAAPVALSAAFTDYDESCEKDDAENKNDNTEPNEDDECWEEELPVISIELQPLVGYKPSTTEEIESIKKQIIRAMWERYRSSRDDSKINQSDNEDAKEQQGKSEEELRQEEEEVPPPDFDDQIKELLNSRVARFGSVDNTNSGSDVATNSSDDKNSNGTLTPASPFLEITYPSRILPTNASSDHETTEETARMWSVVRGLAYALEDETEYREDDEGAGSNNQNDLSFLWHLADHLEHTGRLLWWKYNMALELRDMLFRANLPKKHDLWVREQRKAKLEQLYQVRETLVHRKELANEDFDKLVAEKETAIRKDMLLYDHTVKRNKRNQDSNGDSLFGGGELSFPEQFELMGLLPKDSQLYEEEDWGGTLDDDDDIDYYNSDYSNYSDDDDDYSDGELGDFSGDGEDDSDHERKHSLPPITPEGETTDTAAPGGDDGKGIPERANPESHPIAANDDAAAVAAPNPVWKRNRKRRQKKARAKKQKDQAEAQRREELQKRKDHEGLLEAKHTTQKLVLAQTLLEALSKKVDDVEELLESLQDEEWEAAEKAEAADDDPKTEPSNDDGEGMSLLDQILAMMLGALPMEPGSKDRERHYRYIEKEHQFIVRGWKEYFGELPPALHRTAPDKEEKPPPAGKPPSSAAPAAATPREQRMALGIVDNDDDDWDAMADDD